LGAFRPALSIGIEFFLASFIGHLLVLRWPDREVDIESTLFFKTHQKRPLEIHFIKKIINIVYPSKTLHGKTVTLDFF